VLVSAVYSSTELSILLHVAVKLLTYINKSSYFLVAEDREFWLNLKKKCFEGRRMIKNGMTHCVM
jgi:hypothetical protein